MKKIIAFFISALLVLSLSSCSSGGETYKKRICLIFLTRLRQSPPPISRWPTLTAILIPFIMSYLRYSWLFNIYKDYQGIVNLKYINENAAAAPVKADKAIIDLLLFGKQAYEITGGRVNIAMGAVLSLWHNASQAAAANPENAALPSQADLEAAALHCDIEKADYKRKRVYGLFCRFANEP
ncbi:MAG: FAD:protein FMN transferase [Anaerotruncus sp.]|nr:MAG: FAD:protein FMN transferase [Anaerotruncus sp.]